jgi:hypothetical protein
VIANVLPTDDVSVLALLSQAGRDAIAFKRSQPREFVVELLAATREAIKRPCEDGQRVMNGEHEVFALLVHMADRAIERYDRPRALRLNRAIAAMLPDIQDDGFRAMQLREQTRPTP